MAAVLTITSSNEAGGGFPTVYPAGTAQPERAYLYNGDGLRMTKTANGATSQFVYNTTQPVPEILSDGSWDFIYGPLFQRRTYDGRA